VEVRVTTETYEDTLIKIRRHLDELEARVDGCATETQARLQGRFDRLREEEASAWAAIRAKAEAVDETVRRLEIDIAIAENRLASELAEDATSFKDAVEAELHDWDVAIERLQTRVATREQGAREQAEAEVAALKQARNRAAARLIALRASWDDAWQEQRNRVTEALDDLERSLREAAVKFHRGGEHDD
jgi:hypothetical protein